MEKSNNKKRHIFLDLTGFKSGKLTVLNISTFQKKGGTYWDCRCECGAVVRRIAYSLKTGRSTHCGCSVDNLAKGVTHGLSKTPTYISWSNMKMRCLNENRKSYQMYGAVGIAIDPSWVDSYETFLTDMGERPSISHSLDRIDNAKGYCKENCRWATKKEQSRNRKHVNYYLYNGEMLTVGDIAKMTNQPEERIRYRVRVLGWSIERAAGTPPLDNKNRHYYLRQADKADSAINNSDLK